MPHRMVCVDADELTEMRLQFSAHECTHVDELSCKADDSFVAIPRVLVERLVKRYYSCELMTQENGLWEDWDTLRGYVDVSALHEPAAPIDGGSGEGITHVRISMTEVCASLSARLAKIEERLNKLESPPIDVEAFKKSNPDIFYARDAREIKMAQDRANRVKS